MISVTTAEAIALGLHKTKAEDLRAALQLADDQTEIDPQKFIDFLATQQKTRLKAQWDKAHQAATSDSLGKLEKGIREKFKVSEDVDLSGEELIAHIIEEQTAAAKGSAKGKLSDDEIKKHPIFIDREKALQKMLDDQKKEFDTKLKAEVESREYEKFTAEINAKALEIFGSLGTPVLPEKKDVADKMIKKLLIDEIHAGRKVEKTENGDWVIVKADGKREEDKAGNALSFNELVTTIAQSNFQFAAAQKRDSTGNGGGSGSGSGNGGTKKYTGAAPKNQQEYIQLLMNDQIPLDQKSEIKEVYGNQFK